MNITRRNFLQGLGLASATALAPKLVFGETGTAAGGDVLLCIFQRGGVDGLNMIVPHADADYYAKRPTLAIPVPGAADGALDLDGFFGLHPSMASLLPVYQAGDLAVVHATGSMHETHSHFEAQSLMERGILTDTAIFSGWLGRWIDYAAEPMADTVFKAVGWGNAAQPSLRGDAAALAWTSFNSFALAAPAANSAAIEAALVELFAGGANLDVQAGNTLTALDSLAMADPGQYPVDNGAQYANSGFARQLMEVGQIIKADIGLRVACVDIGGWDTHQGQAPTLNTLLADFADGLSAFHTDMGSRMDGISVVTMSEFGRRVAENGSAGTDHGHGNAMLVMGGSGVNGGQVTAQWPGLNDAALYGPGDLDVTTDFRHVLYELIDKRMGGMPLDQAFPDLASAVDLGLFNP